ARDRALPRHRAHRPAPAGAGRASPRPPLPGRAGAGDPA
ncbi:MAG: hypothetical protein AVDCRST_MAG27-2437, partial [uncultured Craurococcus sp.]